jgi:hypothetical protein
MGFDSTRLLVRAGRVAVVSVALVVLATVRVAFAQAASYAAPSGASPPEPIYWKQDLFLVPYQWSSPAEPAAAHSVSLFVSKDRGTTWHKISEARPHVKAFNYRAEGDGEYWFSVRTLDRYGREWPAGPHQPELRVIVDTRMPQIDELRCTQSGDGSVEIAWRCTDQNLDVNSWAFESQTDISGAWQQVPLTSLTVATNPDANLAAGGIYTGRFVWQPPTGSRLIAIRATIADRAGNSGSYHAQVVVGSAGIAAQQRTAPPIPPTSESPSDLFAAPPAPNPVPQSSGWTSNSAPATAVAQPKANQPWPADTTSHTPFRLSSIAASRPADDVTVYGNPERSSPTFASSADAVPERDDRIDARYAGPVVSTPPSEATVDAAPISVGTSFAPLEPFRQASISRIPSPTEFAASNASAAPDVTIATQHSPSAPPKLVGSRTFALEYDLADSGRWGISKVELWGTRDGGQTWRNFARDGDNRSPLIVTVDDEGLYGFRIVVEGSGSVAKAPSAGDAPELWVAVDLHRPLIELTAIERGEGNFADHLILRWHATDDNLDERPIALFYSSRPGGPWSAIATNLEDTGEYSWRVDRHVPTKFFVRAEARDTAGNLAAYQTRDPIEFAPQAPGGRLLNADTKTPTAAGSDASYR